MAVLEALVECRRTNRIVADQFDDQELGQELQEPAYLAMANACVRWNYVQGACNGSSSGSGGQCY
jgi:hypothetical protein